MLLITIGRHLSTELMACERDLRQFAVVYSFEQTADVLDSWQLTREQLLPLSHRPAAIIWLQSRPGEFAPSEVETIHEAVPNTKLIVITGVFSEGEKRSGKPLVGVAHVPWHHEARRLRTLIAGEHPSSSKPMHHWLAIHAANQTDYLGVASLCQSLDYNTIWQPNHLPRLTSEPQVRLFTDWLAWEAWQSTKKQSLDEASATEILLLHFPRPSDLARARQLNISHVLAQPFSAVDLQAALNDLLTEQKLSTIRLAA